MTDEPVQSSVWDEAAWATIVAEEERRAQRNGRPTSRSEPADPADDAEEDVDTWEPIDLGPYVRGEIERPEPTIGMERADGLTLIYPGKEHAIIGEMESGKSWFSLASCAAEVTQGHHVIYIHFEESDPSDTVDRLLDMGVPGDRIVELLHFVGPAQPAGAAQRRRLLALEPTLVILDGVNEGMALHKQEIREENGAAEFRRVMVKPFTRIGAAVLNCDHVVKDREARDRYGLGSIHKGNALSGSLISLENVDPFGRGIRGASNLYITKDRPGFLRQSGQGTKLPGKTFMGVLVVDDTREHANRIVVNFFAPSEQPEMDDSISVEEVEEQRVMDAIIALMARQMQPSFRHVRAEARLGQTKIQNAISRLVVQGRLREISGERNARLFVPTLPEQ